MKTLNFILCALLTLTACEGFVNPDVPDHYPEAAELMPITEDLPIEWTGNDPSDVYPGSPTPTEPWGGQPLEAVPSNAEASNGLIPGEGFPANWANHLHGRGNRWLRYLAGFFNHTTDDFVYPTTQNRVTTFLPSSGSDVDGNWGMVGTTDQIMEADTLPATLFFPLRRSVPAGARLLTLSAWVDPAVARVDPNQRMILSLHKRTVNSLTGAVTSSTLIDGNDNGTDARQRIVIPLSSLSASDQVMPSVPEEELWIAVGAGSSTTGDAVIQVQINYTDPGPRNF